MLINYLELISALQTAIKEQGKEIQKLIENQDILQKQIDKRIKIIEQKVESLQPEPRLKRGIETDVEMDNRGFKGY